jgi:hypothetical protein
VQKNGGSPAENTAYIKDACVKEESLGRGQTLSVDSLGKVLSCNIASAFIFQNVWHIVLWGLIFVKWLIVVLA